MTSPVVDALAAATAAYLGVLVSGTLDDEADAAMALLAPVGLGGLGPDEESHVIADARRVEVTAHTAPERDDPGRRPVQSGLRHVSPAGQAAYGPAAATDGTATAVSWVAFDRREGDRLWASAGEASPVPLGPPRTVVLRQVVATRGPVTWVVGSERGPHGWWGVVAHEAARPEVREAVGHPDAQAVNAEAAMGTDGSLHVVAQQVVDGTFRVAHHERTATGWTEPTLVSPPGESAWDPGVVAAGAEVWVVCTSHRRGRFRVVARRRVGAHGVRRGGRAARVGDAYPHARVCVDRARRRDVSDPIRMGATRGDPAERTQLGVRAAGRRGRLRTSVAGLPDRASAPPAQLRRPRGGPGPPGRLLERADPGRGERREQRRAEPAAAPGRCRGGLPRRRAPPARHSDVPRRSARGPE